MSRRYYLETSPEGQYRFISLKRSRSHGHHHRLHHHHHRDHDHIEHVHHHCPATKEELKDLVERERSLRETNGHLNRDNQALQNNLQTAESEIRRYQTWVPQLQKENQLLTEENVSLRRSLDSAGHHSAEHHRELERLRGIARKADAEIEDLKTKIKDLMRRGHHSISDRVEELHRRIKDWIRKFDAVEDHNRRLRADIDRQRRYMASQEERLTEYELIMRRRGIVFC